MAPGLCPLYMVSVLALHVDSSEIEEELVSTSFAFVNDSISKAEVHAPPPPPPPPHTHHARARAHTAANPPPITTGSTPHLQQPYSPHAYRAQLLSQYLRVAGRHACRRALRALGPQIDFILHCDPLAEPNDYSMPPLVAARHCFTAEDLRQMRRRAAPPPGPHCPAPLAAARSVTKVTPTLALTSRRPLAPWSRPDPRPFLHPRASRFHPLPRPCPGPELRTPPPTSPYPPPPSDHPRRLVSPTRNLYRSPSGCS